MAHSDRNPKIRSSQRWLPITRFSTLISTLSISVMIASPLFAGVKKICPRLEGQTFVCPVDVGGGGAVCEPGSCDNYGADLYTCSSVALCDGKTCPGKKIKTCTGVCWSPTIKTVPMMVASGGGAGACKDADGGHTVRSCTPVCTTENGCSEVCSDYYVCETGYATLPVVCSPSTMNCIDDYVSTPNVPTNCQCACGDTGMPKPEVPACEVPTCTPRP